MLQRRTPLKSSGFSRQPPRPAKQIEYTPRPRAVVVALPAARRAVVSQPKFDYVRDDRLRDMCRAMACQHCGAAGPGASVTWAHSNQSKHGHGRGIKASDVYVAALCWPCHRELDQGSAHDRAGKVAMWDAAHAKTVAQAIADGTWPAGIGAPVTLRQHGL